MIKINELKDEAYRYYNDILKMRNPKYLDFPEFLDTGDFILCSDDIKDEDYKGKSYFAGKIIDRNFISKKGHLGIVVRSEPKGINPFEEYSRKDIKPIFYLPEDRGIIANLTSLEKLEHDEILEGKSVEEVLNINFSFFPLMREKFDALESDQYAEWYLGKLCTEPILY